MRSLFLCAASEKVPLKWEDCSMQPQAGRCVRLYLLTPAILFFQPLPPRRSRRGCRENPQQCFLNLSGGKASLCPKNDATNPVHPRLVVLSAPSGAGKSTLCELLLKEFPNLVLSISSTTRPRRAYEKEGVHYFFLSTAEFEKRLAAGEFVEWANVHNHLYGTSHQQVQQLLSSNKNVLFDVDVQGAMNLLKHYGSQVLLIFVRPPSMAVLAQRLKKRNESPADIETRLRNAYNELEWTKRYDYTIVNDSLDRAFKELKEIITKECL